MGYQPKRLTQEEVTDAVRAKEMILDQANPVVPCNTCGDRISVAYLYRCYYCHCWFCEDCMGEHLEEKYDKEDRNG